MKKDDTEILQLMLGYLCVTKEAEASLVRKVQILDRFNLGDSQIAQICACTVQAVRNARYIYKKTPHGSKKKK